MKRINWMGLVSICTWRGGLKQCWKITAFLDCCRFGIVLLKLKHIVESANSTNSSIMEFPKTHSAKSVLMESIQIYPWNWSAWLDLASCCTAADDLDTLFVANPCEWMFDFFRAHVLMEQLQHDVAMQHLEKLVQLFPKSTYLTAQRALVHYNVRGTVV